MTCSSRKVMFNSRQDAKVAAERSGVKLYSFRCTDCGMWHLTKQNKAARRRIRSDQRKRLKDYKIHKGYIIPD